MLPIFNPRWPLAGTDEDAGVLIPDSARFEFKTFCHRHRIIPKKYPDALFAGHQPDMGVCGFQQSFPDKTIIEDFLQISFCLKGKSAQHPRFAMTKEIDLPVRAILHPIPDGTSRALFFENGYASVFGHRGKSVAK
jgi:hypothetical protein